jgi:hypothetical protein
MLFNKMDLRYPICTRRKIAVCFEQSVFDDVPTALVTSTLFDEQIYKNGYFINLICIFDKFLGEIKKKRKKKIPVTCLNLSFTPIYVFCSISAHIDGVLGWITEQVHTCADTGYIDLSIFSESNNYEDELDNILMLKYTG